MTQVMEQGAQSVAAMVADAAYLDRAVTLKTPSAPSAVCGLCGPWDD